MFSYRKEQTRQTTHRRSRFTTRNGKSFDSPRFRPDLELLEDRSLPSTTPIVLTTIQEAGDFGNTSSMAQVLPLSPMLATKVQGNLYNTADVDVFQINLTQGQILTADVSRNGLF